MKEVGRCLTARATGLRPQPATQSSQSSVPIASDDVAAYLDGVVGVVEAERYEQSCLWLRYSAEGAVFGKGIGEQRFPWIETGHGYGAIVGRLADMPVFISLLTATVDGHKLLFTHATSVVVDHRLIDAWLDANMPRTAFRADGHLNRVDAGNFHNVFPAQAGVTRTGQDGEAGLVGAADSTRSEGCAQ